MPTKHWTRYFHQSSHRILIKILRSRIYYPYFREEEIEAERRWVVKGRHTSFGSHSFYFLILIAEQWIAPGLQRHEVLRQMLKISPHVCWQAMPSLFERCLPLAFIQILSQHRSSDLASLSESAEIGTSKGKTWRKIRVLRVMHQRTQTLWHTKKAWGKESDIYAFLCVFLCSPHYGLVNMYIYNVSMCINAHYRIPQCCVRLHASIISTLKDVASG